MNSRQRRTTARALEDRRPYGPARARERRRLRQEGRRARRAAARFIRETADLYLPHDAPDEERARLKRTWDEIANRTPTDAEVIADFKDAAETFRTFTDGDGHQRTPEDARGHNRTAIAAAIEQAARDGEARMIE